MSALLDRAHWAVSDGLVVARRNLTHIRYVPEKLIDVTVQPIMFVLLFVYVFGAAIHIPGGGYKQFLMAGILVQTMVFGCASSAVSIADDMAKGVIDRFRSLPMARSAVLAGRTGADLATAVLGLAVIVATGLAIGWRIHAGIGSTVGTFAILLLFTYAMTWVGTCLGLLVRAPDAAQGIAFVFLFPATFLANTFVPTGGMAPWLRAIADWNPISAVVAACRHGFGNPVAAHANSPWPLQHPALASVLWSVAILVVAMPLAVRRYRTASAA